MWKKYFKRGDYLPGQHSARMVFFNDNPSLTAAIHSGVIRPCVHLDKDWVEIVSDGDHITIKEAGEKLRVTESNIIKI